MLFTLQSPKETYPIPNLFCRIPASVADAVVNLDCIKTFSANGLSIFSITVKPVFSNFPRSLPKYPTDCPI